MNVANQSSRSLLTAQVTKLAAIANASDIKNHETINHSAIDDCFQVQRRNMECGLYYLRWLKRLVLCTSDGDLVVLERSKGDVDFNATWAPYEQGLGRAGQVISLLD